MVETNISVTEIIQLIWAVIAGLVFLAVVATGVYWRLINVASHMVRLLTELLGEVKEMSKDNREDHQKFMDMVTRMDERSRKQ